MSEQLLDNAGKSKAEAFAEKMLGTINGAGVALMTSIGHRTGLFDAMAALPPSPPRASPRPPGSTSVTSANGSAR